MTLSRCSLPRLLSFISYFSVYGQSQFASSSCNDVSRTYVGNSPHGPGSIDPWSQRYLTNSKALISKNTQLCPCFTPEERAMTQERRIALKRIPGNYLYPDIPQPHRSTVHACLAGYDEQIYNIINDIKQTEGNEIEVHFYLFHKCKFTLIDSLMTSVKALQDVLTKYHHYICLNKKYVETYKESEHCWYIEKLIMIPSFKHDLPNNMRFTDFKRICASENQDAECQPLILKIDEKVDNANDIKEIEDSENKFELSLSDINGVKDVCYEGVNNKYGSRLNEMFGKGTIKKNLNSGRLNYNYLPYGENQNTPRIPQKALQTQNYWSNNGNIPTARSYALPETEKMHLHEQSNQVFANTEIDEPFTMNRGNGGQVGPTIYLEKQISNTFEPGITMSQSSAQNTFAKITTTQPPSRTTDNTKSKDMQYSMAFLPRELQSTYPTELKVSQESINNNLLTSAPQNNNLYNYHLSATSSDQINSGIGSILQRMPMNTNYLQNNNKNSICDTSLEYQSSSPFVSPIWGTKSSLERNSNIQNIFQANYVPAYSKYKNRALYFNNEKNYIPCYTSPQSFAHRGYNDILPSFKSNEINDQQMFYRAHSNANKFINLNPQQTNTNNSNKNIKKIKEINKSTSQHGLSEENWTFNLENQFPSRTQAIYHTKPSKNIDTSNMISECTQPPRSFGSIYDEKPFIDSTKSILGKYLFSPTNSLISQYEVPKSVLGKISETQPLMYSETGNDQKASNLLHLQNLQTKNHPTSNILSLDGNLLQSQSQFYHTNNWLPTTHLNHGVPAFSALNNVQSVQYSNPLSQIQSSNDQESNIKNSVNHFIPYYSTQWIKKHPGFQSLPSIPSLLSQNVISPTVISPPSHILGIPNDSKLITISPDLVQIHSYTSNTNREPQTKTITSSNEFDNKYSPWKNNIKIKKYLSNSEDLGPGTFGRQPFERLKYAPQQNIESTAYTSETVYEPLQYENVVTEVQPERVEPEQGSTILSYTQPIKTSEFTKYISRNVPVPKSQLKLYNVIPSYTLRDSTLLPNIQSSEMATSPLWIQPYYDKSRLFRPIQNMNEIYHKISEFTPLQKNQQQYFGPMYHTAETLNNSPESNTGTNHINRENKKPGQVSIISSYTRPSTNFEATRDRPNIHRELGPKLSVSKPCQNVGGDYGTTQNKEIYDNIPKYASLQKSQLQQYIGPISYTTQTNSQIRRPEQLSTILSYTSNPNVQLERHIKVPFYTSNKNIPKLSTEEQFVPRLFGRQPCNGIGHYEHEQIYHQPITPFGRHLYPTTEDGSIPYKNNPINPIYSYTTGSKIYGNNNGPSTTSETIAKSAQTQQKIMYPEFDAISDYTKPIDFIKKRYDRFGKSMQLSKIQPLNTSDKIYSKSPSQHILGPKYDEILLNTKQHGVIMPRYQLLSSVSQTPKALDSVTSYTGRLGPKRFPSNICIQRMQGFNDNKKGFNFLPFYTSKQNTPFETGPKSAIHSFKPPSRSQINNGLYPNLQQPESFNMGPSYLPSRDLNLQTHNAKAYLQPQKSTQPKYDYITAYTVPPQDATQNIGSIAFEPKNNNLSLSIMPYESPKVHKILRFSNTINGLFSENISPFSMPPRNILQGYKSGFPTTSDFVQISPASPWLRTVKSGSLTNKIPNSYTISSYSQPLMRISPDLVSGLSSSQSPPYITADLVTKSPYTETWNIRPSSPLFISNVQGDITKIPSLLSIPLNFPESSHEQPNKEKFGSNPPYIQGLNSLGSGSSFLSPLMYPQGPRDLTTKPTYIPSYSIKRDKITPLPPQKYSQRPPTSNPDTTYNTLFKNEPYENITSASPKYYQNPGVMVPGLSHIPFYNKKISETLIPPRSYKIIPEPQLKPHYVTHSSDFVRPLTSKAGYTKSQGSKNPELEPILPCRSFGTIPIKPSVYLQNSVGPGFTYFTSYTNKPDVSLPIASLKYNLTPGTITLGPTSALSLNNPDPTIPLASIPTHSQVTGAVTPSLLYNPSYTNNPDVTIPLISLKHYQKPATSLDLTSVLSRTSRPYGSIPHNLQQYHQSPGLPCISLYTNNPDVKTPLDSLKYQQSPIALTPRYTDIPSYTKPDITTPLASLQYNQAPDTITLGPTSSSLNNPEVIVPFTSIPRYSQGLRTLTSKLPWIPSYTNNKYVITPLTSFKYSQKPATSAMELSSVLSRPSRPHDLAQYYENPKLPYISSYTNNLDVNTPPDLPKYQQSPIALMPRYTDIPSYTKPAINMPLPLLQNNQTPGTIHLRPTFIPLFNNPVETLPFAHTPGYSQGTGAVTPKLPCIPSYINNKDVITPLTSLKYFQKPHNSGMKLTSVLSRTSRPHNLQQYYQSNGLPCISSYTNDPDVKTLLDSPKYQPLTPKYTDIPSYTKPDITMPLFSLPYNQTPGTINLEPTFIPLLKNPVETVPSTPRYSQGLGALTSKLPYSPSYSSNQDVITPLTLFKYSQKPATSAIELTSVLSQTSRPYGTIPNDLRQYYQSPGLPCISSYTNNPDVMIPLDSPKYQLSPITLTPRYTDAHLQYNQIPVTKTQRVTYLPSYNIKSDLNIPRSSLPYNPISSRSPQSTVSPDLVYAPPYFQQPMVGRPICAPLTIRTIWPKSDTSAGSTETRTSIDATSPCYTEINNDIPDYSQLYTQHPSELDLIANNQTPNGIGPNRNVAATAKRQWPSNVAPDSITIPRYTNMPIITSPNGDLMWSNSQNPKYLKNIYDNTRSINFANNNAQSFIKPPHELYDSKPSHTGVKGQRGGSQNANVKPNIIPEGAMSYKNIQPDFQRIRTYNQPSLPTAQPCSLLAQSYLPSWLLPLSDRSKMSMQSPRLLYTGPTQQYDSYTAANIPHAFSSYTEPDSRIKSFDDNKSSSYSQLNKQPSNTEPSVIHNNKMQPTSKLVAPTNIENQMYKNKGTYSTKWKDIFNPITIKYDSIQSFATPTIPLLPSSLPCVSPLQLDPFSMMQQTKLPDSVKYDEISSYSLPSRWPCNTKSSFLINNNIQSKPTGLTRLTTQNKNNNIIGENAALSKEMLRSSYTEPNSISSNYQINKSYVVPILSTVTSSQIFNPCITSQQSLIMSTNPTKTLKPCTSYLPCTQIHNPYAPPGTITPFTMSILSGHQSFLRPGEPPSDVFSSSYLPNTQLYNTCVSPGSLTPFTKNMLSRYELVLHPNETPFDVSSDSYLPNTELYNPCVSTGSFTPFTKNLPTGYGSPLHPNKTPSDISTGSYLPNTQQYNPCVSPGTLTSFTNNIPSGYQILFRPNKTPFGMNKQQSPNDRQDFEKLGSYGTYRTANDQICYDLHRNDIINVTNIGFDSLLDTVKKCLMNNIVQSHGDINKLHTNIPLGEVFVAKPVSTKQVPISCKSIDNGLEVKGYIQKVRVLRPKLVFEENDLEIPSFVPVVKCKEIRDPKEIQRLAVDIIKKHYNNPVVLNSTCDKDRSFILMKNVSFNKDMPLVWPPVCENYDWYTHSGSCKCCCKF